MYHKQIKDEVVLCNGDEYSSATMFQSNDESEGEEKLLRVILPNGSTSVIQARSKDSLRSLLVTLLAKKSDLSVAGIDVFSVDDDKVKHRSY